MCVCCVVCGWRDFCVMRIRCDESVFASTFVCLITMLMLNDCVVLSVVTL